MGDQREMAAKGFAVTAVADGRQGLEKIPEVASDSGEIIVHRCGVQRRKNVRVSRRSGSRALRDI